MTPSELRSALSHVDTIAAEAARGLMKGFRVGVRVEKKGRVDLVTEFDLESEAFIRERLAAAFPSHRLVGEESPPTESRGAANPENDWVWFIDPLDGTTNFVHGHPFFAVSIGLCRGPSAVLGVVVAPALGITWKGLRGEGAFRNGARCSVSACRRLVDALCATGFPYDRQTSEENNVREHAAFLKCAGGIRRCGSAAIDLAMVADGTYDLYWEQKLNPWDMAAGACLVLEAGGRLSDYDGGPADVRRGRLVASNGFVHDEGLAVLSAA